MQQGVTILMVDLDCEMTVRERTQAALYLGLSLLTAAIFASSVAAQSPLSADDLRVIQGGAPERDYHEMLHNFLLGQAAKATEQRLARFDAIHTESDFRKWQNANRERFLQLIGELPSERAPLNAHVTGEVARDGYAVRKVVFESLPEFYVTADLYGPTTGKGPFPAVLAPCGHSENGKAYEVYQHLYIGLAKHGYVVLAYDPIGQGERVQYWDFVHHRNFLENPDNQHSMAGIQEYLLGQDLARYMIWDGVRGIDYLESLPEVDGARLGVTGSSGGGTLTTYISMLDSRVKAASIVTFITSIPKKIAARVNDSDGDPEQDIPSLLAARIDHTEMVGMIAPRPVLIGAATRDFFPIAGTNETFGELQRLYQKLGVSDHIKMVEFDHPHMYSQPLREATYAWFDRWLKGNPAEGEVHEPPIEAEKDEVLQCTHTGQVVTSLAGKRVYDFNRVEAGRLLDNLNEQRGQADFRLELIRRVRERLGSQFELDSTPSPEVTWQRISPTGVGKIVVEKFLLTSEPGIVVPTRVIYVKGQASRLPAVVYLRDRSGEEDTPTLFQNLAEHGRIVAVADVRGFGETMSRQQVPNPHIGYYDPRDGIDADFAYASFFLGRPLMGMRVRDARSVIRFLDSRPDVDRNHISMVGTGWAGAVALLATALDESVSSVALEGVPVSYGEIARAETYEQPVSAVLPGALRDFDLTDVLASLAPRPLLVIDPLDCLTRPMDQQQAVEALKTVRDAYRAGAAEPLFDLVVTTPARDAEATLQEWVLRH
jgi:cephalosporin-C deacetylase-like acetyl esterase